MGLLSMWAIACGESPRAGSLTQALVLETPLWVQDPEVGPSARHGSAMAYDSDRKIVVLFGGRNQVTGTDYGDTWEHDGTTWTQRSFMGATPPAGAGGKMVYDSVRQIIVLAIGRLTALQTWEYDGITWTNRTASISQTMSANADFGFTFDSGRGVAVLYGGLSAGVEVSSTFEYDGVNWAMVAPDGAGPPVFSENDIAYDSFRAVTVLQAANNSTWEWNGLVWQQRAIPGPSSSTNFAMTYDPMRRRIVANARASATTWEYDGVSWTNRGVFSGVTSRRGAPMVFTQFAGPGHLFCGPGGNNFLTAMYNDFWIYRVRGGACTVPSQCDSGNCVDGVCCEQASCGTCQRCDGTSPGVCTAITNAQDPDTCNGANTCGPSGQCGVVDGSTCTLNSQCSSGACVDGRCCNTACAGPCQACDAATRGWAGGVDGVCTNAPVGSSDAQCGPFVCAAGGVCANACTSDAGCSGSQYCAANGQCVSRKLTAAPCNTTSDCKVAGCAVCASGTCADGVCCATACAGSCKSCSVPGSQGTCVDAVAGAVDPRGLCSVQSATTCGFDGKCDGMGGCSVHPLGTICEAATCATTTTQVAPRLCDGFGTCDLSPTNSCGAYACVGTACKTTCTGPSDCAAGNTCLNGACTTNVSCATTCTIDANCCVGEHCVGGACVPGAANGHACGVATDCASGFCAGGVCCNSSCTDACTTCETGTCAVASAGAAAMGTCGGLCDGAHPDCDDSCASDADCRAEFYCGAGATCLARKTNGAACSLAIDCLQSGTCRVCASDHCVDGVCCNAACGGACDACDVPGSVGSCVPSPAGTECAPGSCTGPQTVHTPSQCDGAGACVAGEDRICGGFACTGGACVMTGGAGCNITCAVDSDCCVDQKCLGAFGNKACTSGVAPSITSTAASLAFVEEPYIYDASTQGRVVATGTAPLSYAIDPNSVGATVDASTGLVTWTPTASGQVSLTFRASNAWGSVAQPATVQTGAARAPSILRDAPSTATIGTTYAHTLRATGAPASMVFTRLEPVDLAVTPSGQITWVPSAPGPIPIRVVATNDYGSDEYAFTVDVVGITTLPAPVAIVSAAPTRSDRPPLVVAFDGSSSTGAIRSYDWTFGDGTRSTISEPTQEHTYLAPGGYLAKLRVVDTFDRADSETIGVQVGDGTGALPPVVGIQVDGADRGPAQLAVSLRCDCSMAPGVRLLWLFGDGEESTEPYVNHVYAEPGTYEVSLYGFDPVTGLSGFDRTWVTATLGAKVPPVVQAFAAPSVINLTTSAEMGVAVLSGEASDEDGTIESYRWTLEGVELSSAPTLAHTFTAPGNYTFVVEAIDNDGLVATSRVEVQVLKDGGAVPQFLSIPVKTATVGEPYVYETSVRGTRAIRYALGADAPKGLEIDADGGKVTWTPTKDQIGERKVTLTAANVAGGAVQPYTVTVLANDKKDAGGCQMSAQRPRQTSPSIVALACFLFCAIGRARVRATRRA